MWSYLFVTFGLLFVIQINGFNIQQNSLQPLAMSKENKTSSHCKDKPCIRKCCGIGEYTQKQKCYSGLFYNYSDIPVYDENLKKLDETIPAVFELKPKKFKDEIFKMGSYSALAAGFRSYLMKVLMSFF